MAAPTAGSLLEDGQGGLPLVREQGLNTKKAVNFSGLTVDTSGNMAVPGTLAVTGAFTQTGAQSVTGVFTPTGGVAAGGGFSVPTAFATAGLPVNATTGATQTQIVTTDTYLCEVFIPANTTLTGISILNGHTTSGSQNMMVGIANSSGVVVAKSLTTTAQTAADTFQQIAFTATYSAVGPAKYYVLVQGSATTGYIATHTLGNVGATLVTSETYGTFLTTAAYSTTTFTTARGPIASTY